MIRFECRTHFDAPVDTVWQHEGVLADDRGGCLLTDRVGFEVRAPLRFVPGYATVVRAVLRRLFGHRHRRLDRHLRLSR